MIYYFLFFSCIPLFVFYFICCFIFPLIKIGKNKTGGNIKIYILKDAIHSDYIFESILLDDLFPNNKKFTKVGWGDRKIFLETNSWKNLKIKDFLFAFFGLNETVLRVDFLEEIPKKLKKINVSYEQFLEIKKHIICSYENKKIEKKHSYFQIGDFYKSNLKYNCVTNCNNWINQGLRKAKASNRVWCPLSFWL